MIMILLAGADVVADPEQARLGIIKQGKIHAEGNFLGSAGLLQQIPAQVPLPRNAISDG